MANEIGWKETPKGKRRTKALQDAILDFVKDMVLKEAEVFKTVAMRHSPTAAAEAKLLSEGQVFEVRTLKSGPNKGANRRTSRVVGVPTGGRFFRDGGDLSFREAIQASPIRLRQRSRHEVVASTITYAGLNAVTGFSYDTENRGEQHTLPFNKKLAQAYENGGVWTVRRRTTNMLHPEEGVYVPRMIKTIPPFRMFAIGNATARKEFGPKLDRGIKRILKGSK